MKHISLIALVMAFSVSSFAKTILCSSESERVLVSVSVQEKAINGIHHADTMSILGLNSPKEVIEINDVAGAIDLNKGKAYFVGRYKNKSLENPYTMPVRLAIDSYQELGDVLIQGTLTLGDQNKGMDVLNVNCATNLNIQI